MGQLRSVSKNTHGGARKGAGRKKEDRDRVKLQIVIDRELLNTIDEYLNDESVNRSEFFQQLALNFLTSSCLNSSDRVQNQEQNQRSHP
jgi:metal-responsive CopG/Arc/MetJ family transcriptional regulator